MRVVPHRVATTKRQRNGHDARLAAWRIEGARAKVGFERSVTTAFAEVSTALVAYQKLAETRFGRLATLVDLYRALGGGWRLEDTEWTDRGTLARASP